MLWLFKYIFQAIRKLFSIKWIKLPWLEMLRSAGDVPFTVSKKVLEAYCLFIIPSQLGYLALLAIEQATIEYDFLRMTIFEVAVVVASALAEIIITVVALWWVKSTKRTDLSGIVYKLVMISAAISAVEMCTSVLACLATVIAAPFGSFMYLYDTVVSLIAVALCMQGLLEFAAFVGSNTDELLALWVIKPNIDLEDVGEPENSGLEFDIVEATSDSADTNPEVTETSSNLEVVNAGIASPIIESVVIMPEKRQEPQTYVASDPCIYVGTGVELCDPDSE